MNWDLQSPQRQKNKRKYLKILRGQLSNYEQTMLFYNWMSSYGNQWENDENSYFVKYKMIHNLWYNELNLDFYLKSKLFLLVKKYELLKKVDKDVNAYEKNKELFESGDDSIISFLPSMNIPIIKSYRTISKLKIGNWKICIDYFSKIN